MKQTKKSILGLNTVKAFIVVLLALAIIGVVVLVVLGAIGNNQMIAQTGLSTTTKVANELITPRTTGNSTSVVALGLVSLSCDTTSFKANNNSAAGKAIYSGNYTFTSDCLLSNLTSEFSTVAWNVNYTYTYMADRGIGGVTNNVSTGLISFFTNAGTFFSLLGVVVIILIISLVVVVVNRFGGESQGATEYAST